MIAGAERSELPKSPLARLGRDLFGVRAVQRAIRFEVTGVVVKAEAALHSPLRSPRHRLIEVTRAQREVTLAAHAGRHGRVERVDEPREVRRELLALDIGAQQADAAVDVEADRARTHDAALGVGGDDAADRQAIPLM